MPASIKSNKSAKFSAKLRDSLVNMLGEFVALNKSPDFRLSSASQQFLNEAVLEERRRREALFERHGAPRHLRSVSTNSAAMRAQYRQSEEAAFGGGGAAFSPSGGATGRHSRRPSLPVGPAPCAASTRFNFFPRFHRRVAHADEMARAARRASVISESDETDGGETALNNNTQVPSMYAPKEERPHCARVCYAH